MHVESGRYASVSAMIAHLVSTYIGDNGCAANDTKRGAPSTGALYSARNEPDSANHNTIRSGGWLMDAWIAAKGDADTFVTNVDRAMRAAVSTAVSKTSMRSAAKTMSLSVGAVRVALDGRTPAFDKFLKICAATGGLHHAAESGVNETSTSTNPDFVRQALTTLLVRTKHLESERNQSERHDDVKDKADADFISADADADTPAETAYLAEFRIGREGPTRRLIYPPTIDATLFEAAVCAAFDCIEYTANCSLLLDDGLVYDCDGIPLETVRDDTLASVIDGERRNGGRGVRFLSGCARAFTPATGARLLRTKDKCQELQGAIKTSDRILPTNRVRCIGGYEPDGVLDLATIDRRLCALVKPAGLAVRRRKW